MTIERDRCVTQVYGALRAESVVGVEQLRTGMVGVGVTLQRPSDHRCGNGCGHQKQNRKQQQDCNDDERSGHASIVPTKRLLSPI